MPKFNPKDHLMPVKGGAQYLEVKWRLVWFREDWPNGIMETEPIEITPQQAIFKATVTAVDAEGNPRGSATGTIRASPSTPPATSPSPGRRTRRRGRRAAPPCP